MRQLTLQLLSLVFITVITLFSQPSFSPLIINILLLLWLLQSMMQQKWVHLWYWFLLAVVLLDFCYVGLLLLGVDASTLGIELAVAYLLGAVFSQISGTKKKSARSEEGGAA